MQKKSTGFADDYVEIADIRNGIRFDTQCVALHFHRRVLDGLFANIVSGTADENDITAVTGHYGNQNVVGTCGIGR